MPSNRQIPSRPEIAENLVWRIRTIAGAADVRLQQVPRYPEFDVDFDVACPPFRRMSATTAVPSVSRRPATTTRAPSAAKASAVALPIPDVPSRNECDSVPISLHRRSPLPELIRPFILTASCQTRSGRYRVRARSAAGGVTSDAAFRAGGKQCPRGILLQQVD
jgi:hypothetical protein